MPLRFEHGAALETRPRLEALEVLHDLAVARQMAAGKQMATVSACLPQATISIKVTVDIYGKLVPGANKAAVDRLDADEERVRMTQQSATPAQPEPRKTESAGSGRPVTPRIRMVELRGIEPLTPRLPASCSPS